MEDDMENNNVINALKRLERAGAEDSRTTEKLRESARSLASEIEGMVPHGVKLPRGYRVISRTCHGGASYDFLVKDYHTETEEYIDSGSNFDYYLNGDFDVTIPGQTRKGVLQFAADIATGWLDEVAAFLEERAKKATEATATLTEAAAKLEK
jgi:hypothetical protein